MTTIIGKTKQAVENFKGFQIKQKPPLRPSRTLRKEQQKEQIKINKQKQNKMNYKTKKKPVLAIGLLVVGVLFVGANYFTAGPVTFGKSIDKSIQTSQINTLNETIREQETIIDEQNQIKADAEAVIETTEQAILELNELRASVEKGNLLETETTENEEDTE